MALKKSANNKSTEELLKDLETEIEGKVSERKIQSEDSVITFLRFYNIEPGNQKIKTTYLYKLYKDFTKNPHSSYTFAKKIGNYLTRIAAKYGDHYLINQKVLNLSEKALEILKKNDVDNTHGSLPKKQHFDNFIKKYNIKPGTSDSWIWISTQALFNVYDKWSYSIKKKNPLSLNRFRDLCKVYFPFKQDQMTYYFKITPLDMMSEEQARNSLTNEKKEK